MALLVRVVILGASTVAASELSALAALAVDGATSKKVALGLCHTWAVTDQRLDEPPVKCQVVGSPDWTVLV